MGYVRERKTYRLVFDDGDLAGLEVLARSASVEAYQRVASLAARFAGRELGLPSVEDLAEVDHLFTAFAGVLVWWNLEEPVLDDDGSEVKDGDGQRLLRPVPASLAGLKAQDLPFVMGVVEAWMDAVAGVSPPLGTPSSGGGLSLVESMPMDVLPPSR